MIISDLNYLEVVEESNIEGAGEAQFFEIFTLYVDAQREAYANVAQYIDVRADVRKTINFAKYVAAYAFV